MRSSKVLTGAPNHLRFADLELTGDAKPGTSWIDRQLLAREPAIGGGGFGAELREAMNRRVDHLVEEGLARR